MFSSGIFHVKSELPSQRTQRGATRAARQVSFAKTKGRNKRHLRSQKPFAHSRRGCDLIWPSLFQKREVLVRASDASSAAQIRPPTSPKPAFETTGEGTLLDEQVEPNLPPARVCTRDERSFRWLIQQKPQLCMRICRPSFL